MVLNKERSGRVSGAIFLIGLGIIAFFNYWWPGIMFVIAATMLVGEYMETNTINFSSGRVIGAGVVLIIGLLGAIDFNIDWGKLWPVVLILLGLWVLFRGNFTGGDKAKNE
jgi:hypothetical protein